jgi:DNA-binding transcriptional ArsR family regulator
VTAALHEHRWPLQPLIEASGLSTEALRRRLGLDTPAMVAATLGGLTDIQADHWAIRLGWHPQSVWGWDWIDLADQAAPAHVRLAAVLRDQIEAGDLAPGDQLPIAQVLVEQYDVSRRTVSRALADLRAEGLVASGRNSRWVVVDRDPEAKAS